MSSYQVGCVLLYIYGIFDQSLCLGSFEVASPQLLYLARVHMVICVSQNGAVLMIRNIEQVELAKAPRVPDHLQSEVPRRGPASCLGVVLERSRLLCLQRYEKELFSESAYLDYYRRCHGRLTREQLAVFAGVFSQFCYMI